MRDFKAKSGNIVITPQDETNPWDGDWDIVLKKEDEKIGIVNFKGEKVYGTVPLYVELMPEYRDKKIGRRVISMMVNWAFGFTNIFEVKTLVDEENGMAIHALNAADFVYRDEENKVLEYSITKPKSVWTGAYVVIGTILGVIAGFLFGNAIIGFAAGIVLSVIVGTGLDLKEKRYRESVTGKSDSARSERKR